MARRTSFTPKNTTKGWRINIPAKFAETGKRERHFYTTRQAALDAAAILKEKRDNHGHTAKTISPSLAEQAVSAAALLEPFGVSLLDAARAIAEAEARKRASVAVEVAAKLFTAAKEDLGTKQAQSNRHMFADLLPAFKGRLMATITGAEIAGHISETKKGGAAFNARRGGLVTFWRWCGHPMRGWCNPEELKHVEQRDHVSGEIGTLTLAQATRLMAEAERFNGGECAPGFAIALFTGVRQAELTRLTPADITPEGITVPAAANRKSLRRRFINMPTPLAAWLKAYPIGESVLPANWERKETAVRCLAGWKVSSEMVDPKLLKGEGEPPAWPHNALRHTAASIALSLGKPVEHLIFEHGHTDGVTTLKAHYIGRIARADAKAIWALRPKEKARK